MRSPADIGREIAAAERQIEALKAELVDTPPSDMILPGRFGEATVAFHLETSGPRIVVNRPDWHECTHLGARIKSEDVPRLRAWLDHYYPQES